MLKKYFSVYNHNFLRIDKFSNPKGQKIIRSYELQLQNWLPHLTEK